MGYFKEFSSLEEMVKFEQEREAYYMAQIRAIDKNPFACYKQIILDIFSPKHKALKKLYDGYSGGWWRDEYGRPCAKHINFIDVNAIKPGEICFEVNSYSSNVYILLNPNDNKWVTWHKFSDLT